MAVTNHERVGRALESLKQGLAPFVEREFKAVYKDKALATAQGFMQNEKLNATRPIAEWDVAVLLSVTWFGWNDVFRRILGPGERTLVQELRGARNDWAHQKAFTSDDAYRALDSVARLLTAISAPQAQEVEQAKGELLRLRFDEQVRAEKRKMATGPIESQASHNLKPWREVVSPHKDVASGRYQQAEFAADLWQVHVGEGSDEYRDPVEFFRRTYLTESLKRLLGDGLRRLTGAGGDPVVQLQTNFGGGKTHSMLALYHVCSGADLGKLPGMDVILKEVGMAKLPAVQRAVLVGNKISPGNPTKKEDGTMVRTLWGELAWQLGYAKGGGKEARKAFERIRADDEKATSPGDELRNLFNDYGPCLVLVDEWVAYARQLHDQGDLPGGPFETQFSFAQALTESAKLAKACLLVVSLPASDTSGSPHTRADDAEVGGERGRAALDRLKNVVGRVESSWRPASAEEGFEIVRRRLFEPLSDQKDFLARDTTARGFYELYLSQKAEFPSDCTKADYEKRIKAAYPIHPEIFDRLYTDWSTLLKFQRTRGVLRLMAAVIHSLWEKGDKNPMIMPSTIPIDDPRVQFELTRYLSDNWPPVIEKDVDGPSSLPLRTDGEIPNLGKFSACRRVARTIYLGSAPTVGAAHQGIDDRQIKLGCVMPGEAAAIFGDALRRLADRGTYLYQEGGRYWYSTQPTVTKLADDRAEELKRQTDRVVMEIESWVKSDLKTRADFPRIHAFPDASEDVPDETETRLVVLGTEHPYSKESGSPAEKEATAILEFRGNAPRIYRNSLVFVAADRARLQDLDEAIRKYLAWSSIIEEKGTLDLSPSQVKQAESQVALAEQTVNARIPETFQWLLVPVQASPDAPVKWQSSKLAGTDSLAMRAAKKLRTEGLWMTSWAGTMLRLELDRVPLWRGSHVAVRELEEYFAKFVYLPRLRDSTVLREAVRDGVSKLTWLKDTFGYADRYDEKDARYVGLQTGHIIQLPADGLDGLLVRPDVAAKQIEAEPLTPGGFSPTGGVMPGPKPPAGAPPAIAKGKHYRASVPLNSIRVGTEASRVAEEVIAHLSGLVGADVKVTLEIEATLPPGIPDNVIRVVMENGRTLKFTHHGFEDV